MNISELFWVFLILSMLQPVVKQRLNNAARARQISRIEQLRGSRVILLAHRQETLGFLGFPYLLSERFGADECSSLAGQLSDGRYTHDYPITAKEALAMGLNVSTEIPHEIIELMTLYPPARAPPAECRVLAAAATRPVTDRRAQEALASAETRRAVRSVAGLRHGCG